MFSYLRSLGLAPLDYNNAIQYVPSAPTYTIEVVKAGFAHAQAIVVLMTPDDEVRLKDRFRKPSDHNLEGPSLRGQARPNVLFEAGIAFESHPKETVIVELGDMRSLSDIAGIQTVRLDNSRKRREELRQQLFNARCAINPSSKGWTKAGDFNRALNPRLKKKQLQLLEDLSARDARTRRRAQAILWGHAKEEDLEDLGLAEKKKGK